MPKRDPKGKRKNRTVLTDAQERAKYKARAGELSSQKVTASIELADEKDKWDARTGKIQRDPVYGPDQNHPEQYGNHKFDKSGAEFKDPPQPKPYNDEPSKAGKGAVASLLSGARMLGKKASGGMSTNEVKMSTRPQDGSETKKWYESPDQKDAVTKFSGVDKPAVKKTGVRPAAKTLLSKDEDVTVITPKKRVYSGFGEEDRTAGRKVRGDEEYDSETNKKKKK